VEGHIGEKDEDKSMRNGGSSGYTEKHA